MTIPEATQNHPNCIKTRCGHYVNVFDPDPDTIDIRDIAYALARMPRFGGHTNQFFSVALHSVAVHNVMQEEENRLCALLHDASEAYLIDIPSPIKQHLPEYKKIEEGLMKVIAEKFGFQWPLPEIVKIADQEQLQIEWEELMQYGSCFKEQASFDADEWLFLREFHDIMKIPFHHERP